MEAPLLIAIVAAVLAVAAAYFAMRSRGAEAGAATQNDMLTDLREAAAESDRRLAVATTQLAEIQSQFATAAAERDRLRETEIDLITQVEVQKKEIELQNAKLKDWKKRSAGSWKAPTPRLRRAPQNSRANCWKTTNARPSPPRKNQRNE